MGCMCVHESNLVRDVSSHKDDEKMQSLFERLAHVHFLSFCQYYLTTVTAAQISRHAGSDLAVRYDSSASRA